MNFSHVGPRLISISPILLCGALLFAEGDPKALVRDLIDNIEDPTRGMLLARGSVERVRAAGLPTLPYLVRELSKTKNVQVRLRLLTVVNAVISEAAAASATKKIKLPDEIFQVLDVLVANKDESFVTRYWVTKSFRHVSNEKMVETLSKVLQEDEVKETLQIMAIRAIGTERSGDDILVKYSQSYSFRLREAVCDSLKGAKTKQILGVNFQGLVDPNVLVRQAAIQALIVHTGDPKGYNPHALPDITESWPPIKRWYEWMQSERLRWKPEDQVQFFNCPVPEIRRKVCKSLAGSKRPEVLFTLFTALLDRDENVREEAMSILGSRENAPPRHDIRAAPDKRRPSEIAWAKYVQKEVKKWDWLPQARRSSSSAKAVICEALGGLKQKRVARFLYFMILDSDVDVRTAAINGLNRYRPADNGFSFNPEGTIRERHSEIGPVYEWLKKNQENFADP
jgi:HEAT repeat protein